MVLAEDAEIIAAYSRNQQRAEEFASKHGARDAYTSVEALLADASQPLVEGSLEVMSETVNSTVTYTPDPLALIKWQIEGFNKAITLDEEPRASGPDGLRSVQVTVAMIESARSRRTVTVDPTHVTEYPT